MKIVVEMVSKPAMLGMACDTWMAFAIMADTTKVTPGYISDDDVSSERLYTFTIEMREAKKGRETLI